jgi:glycosyltransferase involved in cell wall biosynthesis
VTGELHYKVYSDFRWPLKTGIGLVMTSMVERAPSHIEIVDLKVQGGIGSPLSPVAVSRALAKAGEGVFWSAGFIPPAIVSVPAVVTVHDLTHLRFYSRLHKLYYDVVLRPLYRRCAAIVCVSEYTRREFLEWSGMPRDNVHVVRNGVSPVFVNNQDALVLPYQYVLYPGNHRGYKNLDRLIAAFSQSSLPKTNIHLVMTGSENAVLMAQARRLRVAEYVHFLGWLEDADLPKVYKGALAVAFVSLYEGFGLPILEAMASGVPVLTSNASSMPEVAGDAALIVNPYSIADIAHGLDRLTSDRALQNELIHRGLDRIARFDWAHSARDLWSIVDRVASPG